MNRAWCFDTYDDPRRYVREAEADHVRLSKMERAARSADKATQAVNPGRTLENSASLIDRARKRLDAFINRQRDAGKGAEEVSDAWSRTEGLIRKALAVFSVAAVKGQIQKALEEFSNQYNAEVQLGVVMKNVGMDQKAFDAIRDRASALESKTTLAATPSSPARPNWEPI